LGGGENGYKRQIEDGGLVVGIEDRLSGVAADKWSAAGNEGVVGHTTDCGPDGEKG
jgi:hypothetical protein